MGEEAAYEIPSIVLSGEVLSLERESEAEWKALATKVREACETHGCFMVLEYGKIPKEELQELFKATKELFDLPVEKKVLYKKERHVKGGYATGNKFYIPIFQTFGIYGEEEVRTVEKLMWPHGNPRFCETLNTMNSNMLELNLLLTRMIFESYGILDYYESKKLNEDIIGNSRVTRYRVPERDEESLGLKPHVDKSILSILCQNSEQGLEALDKQGKWVPVNIPSGALVVIVGDALQVWSNGRVEAVKHKVTVKGDKDRYSCVFFSTLKDGVSMEVPQELVDEEHPPLYRPFVYSDYAEKHVADLSFDGIKVYAGI